MNLKIKRLRPGAHLPTRASAGAAGADLRACCVGAGITLQPLERLLIPTGIAIELPGNDTVGLVFARSGLALKEGLAMANGVGVIDADYRGEVSVPVVNLSDKPITISNGERIAQLLVMPVVIPEMIEYDELSDTERGTGGFGSTGRV
ncbi:MAG: dUTP diphosphatase [Ruminococcaceae bacterium]|nr:dUTP diphosphatase [Oscillospiraceae bacterium]